MTDFCDDKLVALFCPVIFSLRGATFFLNFDPCVLFAACAYYVDELRYVSSDFVNAKNNVDITVPVSVIIKAFLKAEITAYDGSENPCDSD